MENDHKKKAYMKELMGNIESKQKLKENLKYEKAQEANLRLEEQRKVVE